MALPDVITSSPAGLKTISIPNLWQTSSTLPICAVDLPWLHLIQERKADVAQSSRIALRQA